MKNILELDNIIYNNLLSNIIGVYSESGKKWFAQLPTIVERVSEHWNLTDIIPVNNMSFHFVAYAIKDNSQSVVLKIGCDNKAIENEMNILKYFNGIAAVKLLDSELENGALLLHRAVPGITLKSLYPDRVESVMDYYVTTIRKLHQKLLPEKHTFVHGSKWLADLDNINKNKIPKLLVEKAIYIKNYLSATSQNERLLHGDLHLDNILQDSDEWIIIDPKGIVSEIEFEIAAFDFIHPSEFDKKNVNELFEERIQLIAKKSNLNYQRIKGWIFVRLILSAAWSIEDKGNPTWAINLASLLDVDV